MIGATNEVVEAAQIPMLGTVYAMIIVICLVVFRSIRAAICIVLPLAAVSVLTNATMSVLGIGLKLSTLPITALGVGIGVDYGIYKFSRLSHYIRLGYTLDAAYVQTLRETGSAVIFTGLSLSIGVATWAFSPLQFQADMGMLLTFMFIMNMLGGDHRAAGNHRCHGYRGAAETCGPAGGSSTRLIRRPGALPHKREDKDYRAKSMS